MRGFGTTGSADTVASGSRAPDGANAARGCDAGGFAEPAPGLVGGGSEAPAAGGDGARPAGGGEPAGRAGPGGDAAGGGEAGDDVGGEAPGVGAGGEASGGDAPGDGDAPGGGDAARGGDAPGGGDAARGGEAGDSVGGEAPGGDAPAGPPAGSPGGTIGGGTASGSDEGGRGGGTAGRTAVRIGGGGAGGGTAGRTPVSPGDAGGPGGTAGVDVVFGGSAVVTCSPQDGQNFMPAASRDAQRWHALALVSDARALRRSWPHDGQAAAPRSTAVPQAGQKEAATTQGLRIGTGSRWTSSRRGRLVRSLTATGGPARGLRRTTRIAGGAPTLLSTISRCFDGWGAQVPAGGT